MDRIKMLYDLEENVLNYYDNIRFLLLAILLLLIITLLVIIIQNNKQKKDMKIIITFLNTIKNNNIDKS